MPCAKGEKNENGKRCEYEETKPQTVEGAEFMDLMQRCRNQLRTSNFSVTGIDAGAVLLMAEALGYDRTASAEFFSACEGEIVAAINDRLANISKE